jgi:hypothetical protein
LRPLRAARPQAAHRPPAHRPGCTRPPRHKAVAGGAPPPPHRKARLLLSRDTQLSTPTRLSTAMGKPRTGKHHQELAQHDADLPVPELGLEVEVHLVQAAAHQERVGVLQLQVPNAVRTEDLSSHIDDAGQRSGRQWEGRRWRRTYT